MKAKKVIIINPAKQSIYLFKCRPNKWYDLLKCASAIRMNWAWLDGLSMTFNAAGMCDLSKKPAKAKRGFFLKLDRDGLPTDLVLGRAAALAEGGASMPAHITPEYISKHIRFIPPANYDAAVKICHEIQNNLCDSNLKQRLLWRALELCENNVSVRRIKNRVLGWDGIIVARKIDRQPSAESNPLDITSAMDSFHSTFGCDRRDATNRRISSSPWSLPRLMHRRRTFGSR